MSYLALREDTSLRHRTLRGEVSLRLCICENGRRRSASPQKKNCGPCKRKRNEGNLGNLKVKTTRLFSHRCRTKKKVHSPGHQQEHLESYLAIAEFSLQTILHFHTFFLSTIFFLVELLIHWGKMAGQLDCQCYCAT